MRALVILGMALDLIVALFLLLVSGWVIDAWHDARVPWAGVIVTIPWASALILSAGAPVLAVWSIKRGAPKGNVLLTLWAPPVLFVAVCVVGLTLSPP